MTAPTKVTETDILTPRIGTMDLVSLSSISSEEGNRDATSPVPGGLRIVFLGAIAWGIVWVAQWSGVGIDDTTKEAMSVFLLGLIEFGRKTLAEKRAES